MSAFNVLWKLLKALSFTSWLINSKEVVARVQKYCLQGQVYTHTHIVLSDQWLHRVYARVCLHVCVHVMRVMALISDCIKGEYVCGWLGVMKSASGLSLLILSLVSLSPGVCVTSLLRPESLLIRSYWYEGYCWRSHIMSSSVWSPYLHGLSVSTFWTVKHRSSIHS